MKILFDCLGFNSATVFVEKENRQHQIGFLTNRIRWEFDYFGLYERHLTKDEIPTPEQVITEYFKQWNEKKGKSTINESIVYAG
jgi:hypothetical protein